MARMLESQKYLSVGEAAAALERTTGRIRQMLLAGELAGSKLGARIWAIPSTEIDRIKRDRGRRANGRHNR